MSSLQHSRSWARLPWTRIWTWLAITYALLFVTLSARRSMCLEAQCWANAATRIESGILFLWVKDRETLFSAMIALLAAIIAAYYLKEQINNERAARQSAEQAERARQERIYRAARAVTPLALSEVTNYASKLTKAWVFARDRMAEHPVAQVPMGMDLDAPPSLDDVVFPTLGGSVINDLKAMIEASEEDVARPFIALLQQIQILGARARNWIEQRDGDAPNPPWDEHWAVGQAVEAADLYAKASALFLIARQEGLDEALPPDAPVQVTGALNLMGLHDFAHADLHDRARLLYR